jgi:hypothetical protein
MDKDNEYAGKHESRPVDAKVSETERDLTLLDPAHITSRVATSFRNYSLWSLDENSIA